MTTVSATAAAHAAAPLSATPANTARPPASPRPRVFFSPISNAVAASTRPRLRAAMERAFGASDAEGAWDWKTAYDACEAATVLFLRKFGPAMRARAASPAAMLPMLAKIAGLLPTHTRRSEESEALQQFSTPIALGLAASTAAAITPADSVLEPSAGTGLLAILAELAGGALVLNELADTRAGLLGLLFPGVAVTRFDAAQIDDHLDAGVTPSVVLMNPPFSAMAQRRSPHGRRRAPSYQLGPGAPRRRRSARRHHRGELRAGQPGMERRLRPVAGTRPRGVLGRDRRRGLRQAWHDHRHAADRDRQAARPTIRRLSRLRQAIAPDAATLLSWVTQHIPARLPIATCRRGSPGRTSGHSADSPRIRHAPVLRSGQHREPEAVELAYETVDWTPAEGGRITDALYEEYGLQSIRISGSQAHPTKLVQSAAMASVAPPKPSYRPHLSANIVADGLLSDAQLEIRHLCRRGPSGLPRGIVDGRRDLRCRLRRARRRRECRPLPARLVPRRRHRRRQGPPGRRHPARQLAEGPPPRGLGVRSPTS